MCPPGYYQSASGPMAAHVLWQVLYGYKLLVLHNKRVFIKSGKEHNKTGKKRLMTHSVVNFCRSMMSVIYRSTKKDRKYALKVITNLPIAS